MIPTPRGEGNEIHSFPAFHVGKVSGQSRMCEKQKPLPGYGCPLTPFYNISQTALASQERRGVVS